MKRKPSTHGGNSDRISNPNIDARKDSNPYVDHESLIVRNPQIGLMKKTNMTIAHQASEPIGRTSKVVPNTAKHELEDDCTPYSPKIMIKLKGLGGQNVDKVTRVKQRQQSKSSMSERQETELRIKAIMDQRRVNNNSKVQNRNINSLHPNLLSSSSQSSKNSKNIPPQSMINFNKIKKPGMPLDHLSSQPHLQAKHFKLEQKGLKSQISKVRQPSQVSSLSSSKDNFEQTRKSLPIKTKQQESNKISISSRFLLKEKQPKKLSSHDLISQPSERLQRKIKQQIVARPDSNRVFNGVRKQQLSGQPQLIKKRFVENAPQSYYQQQNDEQNKPKNTVINVPKEAMKCNTHGRELRRIETKFKSQVSIGSEPSVGPSVRMELKKIHSPARFFDKSYKNQTELKMNKLGSSPDFEISNSGPTAVSRVDPSQQIKPFTLQASDRRPDPIRPTMSSRPRCSKIKLQEKLKPLDNSMIAKESQNATISSIENSQEFNIGSHRDEEISESGDENNMNPHQQIASLKPNKIMLDQKLQVQSLVYGNMNNQGSPRRNKNKASMLSGQSRLSTVRLETQQIDKATKKYPQKSEQVSQFQFSKNQSADVSLGKTQMKDYFNMKPDVVQRNDIFYQSRLCLRLQNLQQLHPKVLVGRYNLLHLDLRNNRLKKLPDQICELILLREILLDYNFLKDLPYGLDRLKHLKLLSLSQNLLKRLPTSLLFPDSQLEHLHLNDNKLTSIPEGISHLKNLNSFFIQNNQIALVPINFFKCSKLKQFGLDWFVYLWADSTSAAKRSDFNEEYCLVNPTKVLKTDESMMQQPTRECQNELKALQNQHIKILNHFMKMCKLVQVNGTHRLVEEVRQRNMFNPQQDDYETEREQTVTIRDKGVKYITFLQFLMFFLGITQLEQLVLNKQFHGNKHRKLSHLLAMNGHDFLFKSLVSNIQDYQDSIFIRKGSFSQTSTNIRHLFINAVDQDFSTPLILALKNKKYAMINVLLKTRQICLRQSSMKYGSPLHVALHNEDFQNALRIIKILKANKHQVTIQDLNKHDEEGNTPLHLVLKNFHQDISKSIKIAIELIKLGARLDIQNKLMFSPLNYACFFGQTEAVRFAIDFNLKQKRKQGKQMMFDLSDRGGKLEFTPLHHAVFQNNFVLITMLLNQNVDHRKRDIEGRMPLNLCNSISSVFKTIRHQHQQDRLRKIQELKATRARLIQTEVVHHNISVSAVRKYLKPPLTMVRREVVVAGVGSQVRVEADVGLKIKSNRQAHSLNTTRVHSPDRLNQASQVADQRLQFSRRDRSQEHVRETINLSDDRRALKGIRSINEIMHFAEANLAQSDGDLDDHILQTEHSLFKRKRQMIHCMQIPDKFKKNLNIKGTLATKIKPEFHWQSKATKYRKGVEISKPSMIQIDNTLRIKSKVGSLSSDEELEILNQQTENEIENNAVENISIESKSIMKSQISQIHNQYKEWIDHQETVKSIKSSSLKISEEIDRNCRSDNSYVVSSEGGETRSLSPMSSIESNPSDSSNYMPNLVRQLNQKFNVFHCSNSDLISHLCSFFDLEVLSSIKDLHTMESIMLSFDKTGSTPLISAETVCQLLSKGAKGAQIKQEISDQDSSNSNCNFSISDGEAAADQYNHVLLNSTLEKVKQNAQRNHLKHLNLDDSIRVVDISSDNDPNVYTIKEEDYKRTTAEFDLKQVFEYQQKVKQESQTQMNTVKVSLDQSIEANGKIAKGKIEGGFNFDMKKKKFYGTIDSADFLSNQSKIEDETTFQNQAMSHIHIGTQMIQNKKHMYLELDSTEMPPVQMVLTILQKYGSSSMPKMTQDLSPIDRQHLSLYLQRVQMHLYNPNEEVRQQVSKISEVVIEAMKLSTTHPFFRWFTNEVTQTHFHFQQITPKQQRIQAKKDLPMQFKPNLMKTVKPQSSQTVSGAAMKQSHPQKKPISWAIPPRQGRLKQ